MPHDPILAELDKSIAALEAQIARGKEKPIEIRRLTAEPIYIGTQGIGSRVWDNDVELAEDDPRFIKAVTQRHDPANHGILGGTADHSCQRRSGGRRV